MHSGHQHKCSSASLSLESSSNSSLCTIASFESKRKVKRYLKLIDLYKDHECLWNQCDKNFFNFDLREEMWEDIARQMQRDSDPNKWKFLIHKLRYKVAREKINERAALFKYTANASRPKLAYSDKFQFLNHMFDRKRGASGSYHLASTPRMLEDEASGSLGSGGQAQESLTARCLRLGRSRAKNCPFYASKLKTLETLRDSQSSNLIFTPEVYRKITNLISGSPSTTAPGRTKINK